MEFSINTNFNGSNNKKRMLAVEEGGVIISGGGSINDENEEERGVKEDELPLPQEEELLTSEEDKDQENWSPLESSKYDQTSIKDVLIQHKRNFILILLYSFFLWFLPSEPYFVDYLSEEKGFSSTQIYQNIFPIWTYSYCIFVIILGLLGEISYYKIPVVIGSLGLLVAAIILVFPMTYTENASYYYLIILDEIAEGIGSASGCVFLSFIFISFPPKAFAIVLGLNKGLILFATVTSSIFGGIVVTFTKWSLVSLFYISLLSIIIVFVCSTLLKEKRKTIFKKLEFEHLISDVKKTLNNYDLLVISIWNSICLATHVLVITYIQSLFSNVSDNTNLNGFIYSLAYFFAVIATLIPIFIPRYIMVKYSPWMMAITPLICGVLLVIMGFSLNSAVVYTLFIAYHTLFEFINTISTLMMALIMDNKRYATLFSTAQMLSLLYQTFLQFIVGKNVLSLTIGKEFVAFGVSYLVLGVMFSVFVVFKYIYKVQKLN